MNAPQFLRNVHSMLREESVSYFPSFSNSTHFSTAIFLTAAGIARRKEFMKSIRILLCLSVCLFIPSGVTLAQGVGASGSVAGTITDTSGAVVANATVTVTDSQRGTKRTATTDSVGHYQITGLFPAAYSLSVERTGFQTAVEKNVVVYVGQTVVLDFSLKVSTVTSTVEVTAASPLVETERGSQASTVTSRYISD